MAGPSTARCLRVLTVNIHKGYTAFRGRDMFQDLREAVRAVASDLVLLQEVSGRHDGLGSAQAEYLADTLWRDHAWARNALVRIGGHGNAVLSRWPLLRLDCIYVRGVATHRPLPLPRRPWAQLSDHAPLAAEIAV